MKTKGNAILLAILLGGVGAHRFYLGNTGIAILYILFCWTLIPYFIALIEVIYFAFMKQKEFDLNYNGEAIRNRKAVEEYYNDKK